MSGTQPAPTVPDEAIDAAAPHIDGTQHVLYASEVEEDGCQTCREAMTRTRAALAAAAPFIVAANQPDAAEVERLRAQRDAVLAVHREDGWGFCQACVTNKPVVGSHIPWPCLTVRALGVETAEVAS